MHLLTVIDCELTAKTKKGAGSEAMGFDELSHSDCQWPYWFF